MPENRELWPKYRQISADLAEKIETGEYVVGSRLPSIIKLVDLYGVSYGTIRNSLSQLELDGLIQREQGIGTSVIRRAKIELPPTYTSALNRFQDFLSNPNIAEEAKDRVIEILDSQIGSDELPK